MSDLSELIEITKNIEKQNTEIIRLLKKIAGEDENNDKAKQKEILSYPIDFGELYSSNDPIEEIADEKSEIENTFKIGDILENSIDIGEVYFIEGGDIFKLSIENDEQTIENLTGESEAAEFALQELIAAESVKNNVSLEDDSILLSTAQCQNLPETLKICVEQGAKKIYMPLFASGQLVGAPQILMDLLKFDFFKNEEHLVEKLFG